MNILHLEASPGWGGQEMRILKEALGMRKRSHQVYFAGESSGELIKYAKNEGFVAFPINFKKIYWLFSFFRLVHIVWKYDIDIINTHSSLDAWLGGLVGRFLNRSIIRTRHLSTPIKKGWNSRLLYHYLTDFVVTTCEKMVPIISSQSGKPLQYCQSIPTGVNPKEYTFSLEQVSQFRKTYGINQSDCLVGMACFMRSWKGIEEFLFAADLLRNQRDIKWVIIGGGHEKKYRQLAKELNLEDKVIFTSHLTNPFPAIASLDIFTLLSTAHEGISQASLQAAYLKKPLITTPVGGLWEVCIDKVTGIQVPIRSPKSVAEAVMLLKKDKDLQMKMGEEARKLVLGNFTYEHMLNKMEKVYHTIIGV